MDLIMACGYPTSALAVILCILSVGEIPASWATEAGVLIIIPENTDQPREGDSVTLDCQLPIVETLLVRWYKRNITSITITQLVDEDGLIISQTDDRFSLDPLVLVNATGSVYSQRLTIASIQQSDEGIYTCTAYTNPSGSITASAAASLDVYSADEFPVCTPNGQAPVMNGSSLSCRTLTDGRIPSVAVPGIPSPVKDWIESTAGRGTGSELTKVVTTKDNSSTFTCYSLSNMSMAGLSCQIGPLTVTTDGGGLTGADIAGIIVGSIVLLILIALHALCCRCNPRKWMRAKSYLIGSSSLETNRREEPGNSQSNTNDASLPYDTEPGSKDEETTDDPAISSGPKQSGKTTEDDISINIENTSNVPEDKSAPAENGIQRFAINRKGELDKPDVPDASVSDPSHQDTPRIQDTSAIYAKVKKNDDSTVPKPKNLKRFAINRKGKEDKPPKPEPLVLYAEMDLPENTEVRPLSESPTLYAEIKH